MTLNSIGGIKVLEYILTGVLLVLSISLLIYAIKKEK